MRHRCTSHRSAYRADRILLASLGIKVKPLFACLPGCPDFAPHVRSPASTRIVFTACCSIACTILAEKKRYRRTNAYKQCDRVLYLKVAVGCRRFEKMLLTLSIFRVVNAFLTPTHATWHTETSIRFLQTTIMICSLLITTRLQAALYSRVQIQIFLWCDNEDKFLHNGLMHNPTCTSRNNNK